MGIKKIKKLIFVFLIILLSFLSGFFGGLTILMTRKIKVPFFKELDLDKYLPHKEIILETKEILKIAKEEELDRITKEIEGKIARIYKKKIRKDILEKIYLEKDILGYGAVLTTDGWIISHTQAFPDLKKNYVLEIEGRNYEIKEFLKDPLTGIVFLKVPADGLGVVKLAEKEDIFLGEEVFLFTGKKLETARIKELRFKEVFKKEDLIENSEKFSRYILLDKEFKNYQGSAIFNFKGAVIGILNKENVIPINYFKNLIPRILKEKEIRRSFLGVNYLDLSYTRVKELDKGALIHSLVKNSPAHKAGLKINDIILKVENYILDEKNPLNELIQEYLPGDVIKITFLREKEEKTIEVKLEKLK